MLNQEKKLNPMSENLEWNQRQWQWLIDVKSYKLNI